MKPLVTVIVLCYRNFRYVYQALNSVFAQDYPNIELIVSDDGSANFPEQKLRKYIEQHKSDRITSWRVNRNETNLGTVKHLNVVAKMAKGDYFMSLSADDMIDHPQVVSTYVQKLSSRPDADILMAQIAMYDERMKQIQYYFVQPHIREILLNRQKTDDLYNELVQHPYLPSVGTFFAHSFFEKYGYFDEQYDLVEDWSLHLKIARQHIPIVYSDFVAVRHRSGGVSHGNSEGTRRVYARYQKDLQRTYQQEIVPYMKQIDPDIRERVRHNHRMDLAWSRWHMKEGKKSIPWVLFYLFSFLDVITLRCLPSIRSRAQGKQWNPLLAGLALRLLSVWLSNVLAGSWASLFVDGSLFLSGISHLLIGAGIAFLILYYIAAFFTVVKGAMQLYF